MSAHRTKADLSLLKRDLDRLQEQEAQSNSEYPKFEGAIKRLALSIRLLESGVPFVEEHIHGICAGGKMILSLDAKKFRWVKFRAGNGGWKDVMNFERLLQYAGAPCQEPARPENVSPQPERQEAPYKSILIKTDEATLKAFKRIALDEGKFVGDLAIEAVNLLFASRGKPQIAVKVTPDESERPRRKGARS